MSGARCCLCPLLVKWWREGGREGGRGGWMRARCTVEKEVYNRKAEGFMRIGRRKIKKKQK